MFFSSCRFVTFATQVVIAAFCKCFPSYGKSDFTFQLFATARSSGVEPSSQPIDFDPGRCFLA